MVGGGLEGVGALGIGKLLLNSYRAFVWANGKLFEIVVMVGQHCEYN